MRIDPANALSTAATVFASQADAVVRDVLTA